MISDARRAAVCTWLACNGIDPNDVPIDSTIVVNEHTITLDVYARNEAGAITVDPQAEGPVIARRTFPCVSRPPEAWPA